MYKKTKNGSFMNWIWFFICIAPILLLIIYSIGFFNSKDLESNQNDKYTLELNSINGNTLKEETNLFNTSIINIDYGALTLNENKSINLEFNNNNGVRFDLTNYITNWYIQETTSLYPYSFTNNSNDTISTQLDIYTTYNGITTSNNIYLYSNINNDNYYNFDLRTLITNKLSELQYESIYQIYLEYSFINQAHEEGNRTFILSNNNLMLNKNWFNNYINYINDFNTIKYNSCPISYTYNNLTYNIETNSNNYLGINESIVINQNFNYTQDEEIILNYNNYFPSNVNITNETITGNNIGNNIPQNSVNLLKCNDNNIPFNTTYTYYELKDGYYLIKSVSSQNVYNLLYTRLYVNRETINNYDFEYYNIESTTNTSLTLIPNNTYQDYLNNINDTLKTNGFIANTFLNLSTYFGVNNFYYSLACYYVEYLLIIILLHLAFDILYILPNICHKFMEKIGGERD